VLGGKYRLTRALGEGSAGVVLEAVHVTSGRRFAVKALHKQAEATVEQRSRLMREARAYGAIAHPNVIEIYDVDETEDGAPYLVMELCEGRTLEKLIEQRGALLEKQALRIAWQIASALEAAHAVSVLHRDLKPANVFLHREATGESTAKLLDFGLSKHTRREETFQTRAGATLGSPAYMSPEQMRSESAIDARADLWSFGAVLFEMLTGTRAFRGTSLPEVVMAVTAGPIPRVAERAPDADPRLDALVAACLERDVDKRVQSATALLALLEPMLERSNVRPARALVPSQAIWGTPSSPSEPPLSQSAPRRSAPPQRALPAESAFADPRSRGDSAFADPRSRGDSAFADPRSRGDSAFADPMGELPTRIATIPPGARTSAPPAPVNVVPNLENKANSIEALRSNPPPAPAPNAGTGTGRDLDKRTLSAMLGFALLVTMAAFVLATLILRRC
jgi:serine/threonine-protein kinase